MEKPKVLVVTGPTAVGKTELTISLAKKLNLSILSFDSRQFYKELSIGTAKPSLTEQNGVTHYFINSHSITNPLTAASFETQALPLLEELINTQGSVILTGGSGMYLNALLQGIEPKPHIPEAITNQLNNAYEEKGLNHLVQELQEKDPIYAASADIQNARRVIRALSIIRFTGKPYSSFISGSKQNRSWNYDTYILNREREELYQRINQRVDLMIKAGLIDEAKAVSEHKDLAVLKTVGYQELYPYLNGDYNLNRAIELIKRNSRRYAKRQLTWFRRMNDAQWMHPNEFKTHFELNY